MMPPVPSYGISYAVTYFAIAASALLAIGSLVFCVYMARRRRSALPLILFAAGVLTIFLEPFADVLGLGVFPDQNQVPWITAFHRHLPMYVGLIYMLYWAPGWLLLSDEFDKRPTRRRYWTICAGAVIGTCVFELIPLHFRLWQYYGTQPLRLGGFPLWWGFVNGHSIIASTVVFMLLLRVLPANRRWLLIVLMPAVVVAVHTGGSMPGYLTVGSTSNATITWLGTLGAMALTTLLCWIYSLWVCRPSEATHSAQADPDHQPAKRASARNL
jgi:hypothetical protein